MGVEDERMLEERDVNEEEAEGGMEEPEGRGRVEGAVDGGLAGEGGGEEEGLGGIAREGRGRGAGAILGSGGRQPLAPDSSGQWSEKGERPTNCLHRT